MNTKITIISPLNPDCVVHGVIWGDATLQKIEDMVDTVHYLSPEMPPAAKPQSKRDYIIKLEPFTFPR